MTAQTISGVPAPSPVPDLVISPGVQPNVNLGASVPFGKEKEIDIGLFTDLSSVSQVDIEKNGASRVNMYGASMTLGLLGKQSRAWFGLAGELGHTTIALPGRDFTFERVSTLPAWRLPADADATLVRSTVTGILGSNYSFLD